MNTQLKKYQLQNLFESKKLRVPSYQRAYAWEEGQLKDFIFDMLEITKKEDGVYYFGHFILEDSNDYFEIIDGQQRITTFILFLMICRLVETKNLFKTDESLDRFINKFETVDYDLKSFKLIQEKLKDTNHDWNFNSFELPQDEQNLSIKNILFALNYFRKLFKDAKLKVLDIQEIDKYIEIFKNSEISIHTTNNKAVSVQIFELQNTRGVKLNLIEKVKSKLMKAVYLNTEAGKSDEKIKLIQGEFAKIYQLEEQITANVFRGDLLLDDVLLHHLRMIDDGSKLKSDKNLFNSPSKSGNKEDSILNYINERINEKSKQEVVEYIINLSEKFRLSVELVSKILTEYDKSNRLIGDVLILEKSLSVEFFILLFHLNKKDLLEDIELIQEWEKLLFMRDFHDKYYGLVYRDNFEGLFFKCLNEDIKQVIYKYVKEGFRENIGNLHETVSNYIEQNRSNILNNAFYWWNEKMVYILYKYEISQKADLNMLRKIMKEGRSVEHILPQSWEWEWIDENDPNNISENGNLINKEIQNIINGLGNLLLISSGENSSVSNKHPNEKIYNSCEGGSYAEHNKNKEKWKDYSEWKIIINNRGENIFEFMKKFIV